MQSSLDDDQVFAVGLEAKLAAISHVELGRTAIARRQTSGQIDAFERTKAHPLEGYDPIAASAEKLDHLRRSGKRLDAEPAVTAQKFADFFLGRLESLVGGFPSFVLANRAGFPVNH
jgi:hypothetical protein